MALEAFDETLFDVACKQFLASWISKSADIVLIVNASAPCGCRRHFTVSTRKMYRISNGGEHGEKVVLVMLG